MLFHTSPIVIVHVIIHVHVHTINFIFSGDVTIPGGMTLAVDSDLNGASPQFTLTCISTGGPATTVTWTRDSEVVVGSTVLDNAETGTYTHTLTVTGRTEGLYRCSVSNSKPSSAAAELNVSGIVYSLWNIVLQFISLPPSPSPLPSLWSECVSEWAGQCTSVLDSSIRRSCCDWLHHLLPAGGGRTEALREC